MRRPRALACMPGYRCSITDVLYGNTMLDVVRCFIFYIYMRKMGSAKKISNHFLSGKLLQYIWLWSGRSTSSDWEKWLKWTVNQVRRMKEWLTCAKIHPACSRQMKITVSHMERIHCIQSWGFFQIGTEKPFLPPPVPRTMILLCCKVDGVKYEVAARRAVLHSGNNARLSLLNKITCQFETRLIVRNLSYTKIIGGY